jgi:hypothetical protein
MVEVGDNELQFVSATAADQQIDQDERIGAPGDGDQSGLAAQPEAWQSVLKSLEQAHDRNLTTAVVQSSELLSMLGRVLGHLPKTGHEAP